MNDIEYHLNILNQVSTVSLNNPTSLIKAWNKLSIENKTSDMKLFVKANLDSFYRSTLEFYPRLNQLLPAGFFDDSLEPGTFDYQLGFFTTPVHKIIQQIELINISESVIDKPYVVLLNTGSYSPIHNGHLMMMNQAREALSPDYYVMGGYFSPSHDNYVSTKYEGTAKLHCDARIALCEEVVAESDWLMIDPWEARYNRVSINFTDVITRLSIYLKKHVKHDIKIAYVFGSDNAGFSWAFVQNGLSVCFERPGYELQFNTVKNDPLISNNNNNKRHYFIDNKNNTYSSKDIRNGNLTFLPEKIKHLYLQYKTSLSSVAIPLYLLRDDREFATQYLNSKNNLSFKDDIEIFYQGLINTIKQSFNYMDVMTLDVASQNENLNTIKSPLINLDSCTYHPQQKTIALSRQFFLSDGQVFAPNLIARPGHRSIENQILDIQDGSYILVDDDIASGRTMELVRQLLPEHVFINEYLALSRQSFHQQYDMSYKFHDIVDFRDFLIGSHEGGLVVQLPNQDIARAPYVWPYVSLAHRAKIPALKQKAFSLSVWSLNLIFYQKHPIKISETDKYFQALAYYLNFNENTLMSEFCQWHINHLK